MLVTTAPSLLKVPAQPAAQRIIGTGLPNPQDRTKQAIGKRLRMARLGRGLSQADIASWSGTSCAAVSQWELGHAMPTSEHLECTARRLDVSFDWLRANIGARPTFVPAIGIALTITDAELVELAKLIGADGWLEIAARAGL
jgi:transcriptional regulator with XRE-family HTH domain